MTKPKRQGKLRFSHLCKFQLHFSGMVGFIIDRGDLRPCCNVSMTYRNRKTGLAEDEMHIMGFSMANGEGGAWVYREYDPDKLGREARVPWFKSRAKDGGWFCRRADFDRAVELVVEAYHAQNVVSAPVIEDIPRVWW